MLNAQCETRQKVPAFAEGRKEIAATVRCNDFGIRVVVVRTAASAVYGIEFVLRERVRHVIVVAEVEHMSCRFQHFLSTSVVEVAVLRVVC